MATTAASVTDVCLAAREASRALAGLDSAAKDAALLAMAAALEDRAAEILEANARDMDAGPEGGLGPALLDRLSLDEARLAGDRLRRPDDRRACPIPWVRRSRVTGCPTASTCASVRVPLGVVAVVYEARPNVTIDCSALCLKSGNAIVLRGSSTAAHSNAVLAQVASSAVASAGHARRPRSRSWRAASATSCASSRPRTAWST